MTFHSLHQRCFLPFQKAALYVNTKNYPNRPSLKKKSVKRQNCNSLARELQSKSNKTRSISVKAKLPKCLKMKIILPRKTIHVKN